MKTTLLLALALGACSQPGEFRGSVLHTDHPLTAYVLAEKAAGRHPALSIESTGGSTAAWRGLAAASVSAGASVTLRGECVSACLLYALTVAAKGVPVHVAPGTQLLFHRIGVQYTQGMQTVYQPGGGSVFSGPTVIAQPIYPNRATPMQAAFDLALWQIAGLPQWAVEVERGLTVHDLRPMTQNEANKSGFTQ